MSQFWGSRSALLVGFADELPTISRSQVGRLTERLGMLCAQADSDVPTWCIFDNTALGSAAENALHLLDRSHADGTRSATCSGS